MTYLFDGINHPTVAQVRASGAVGCLMYGGTPAGSLGKDFTAAQYASYKDAGLLCAFVYENTANDMAGGFGAGSAHAQALLADLRTKGVASTEPVGATVDEHVSAANIPLAVEYQMGFHDTIRARGWTGPVGAYGFAEFLVAVHDGGAADWFWGAGNRASLPSYTNVWQDNTGTINVGGSADDRDWILVPLPTGGDMSFDLTTPLPDPASVAGTGTVAEALTNMLFGIGGKRQAGAGANELAQIDADVQAVAGAVTSEQAAILAAIKAQPTGGQVDVTALATSLAPTLAKLLPQSTPAEVGAAVEQALAAQFAK